MITLLRTSVENKEFNALINALDADLAITDGDDHSFYSQFNNTDLIKHVVILYDNGIASSCGALREESTKRMEIKRMYTIPKSRGHGLAAMVLNELENWAREMSYTQCILETGNKQLGAIKLYKKNQYQRITNYGPYKGIAGSLCFGKELHRP
tara:strand:+ start:294 stop:752 length:459 start_codon:yes stop_codon:yes gene_type:complete